MISTEARTNRHQKRFGFGAGSPSPLGGGFFGAQPGPRDAQSSSRSGIARRNDSSAWR